MPAAPAALPADLVVTGGPIHTLDDARPTADAVAVTGDTITAVGSRETVEAVCGPETERLDLDGATLLPGFIDAHGHFSIGLRLATWVDVSGPPLGGVRTIADLAPRLREHADRRGLGPGDWVIGYGYDRTAYADGREATRHDLDACFADRPVVLVHVSNHGAVLNSAALAATGYAAATPTPPGGMIVREPDGHPAGFLMETAFFAVLGALPRTEPSELLARIPALEAMYTRAGVTTAHDGATTGEELRLLRGAAATGDLALDVVAVPLAEDPERLLAALARPVTAPGGRSDGPRALGERRGRLTVRGLKLLLDGSPQGKTACWTHPLLTPGPGGETEWRGVPTMTAAAVSAAVRAAAAHRVPVFAHVNGDGAIDQLIEAVAAAGLTAAHDHRTVAVHSQCMRPDQIDAFARLGITPSFFVVHTYFWGEEHLTNLGPERASFISPMASARAAGLRMTNHNDFPITPVDPMRMIWSATTRQTTTGRILGPDERVDRVTAVRALTADAAWQVGAEDRIGRIAPGLAADLVVLDRDPLTVAAAELPATSTVRIYKEGRVRPMSDS